MTFRLSLIVLGLAGWATWLPATAVAADDVGVLTRGPVHEAYAEPSEREPKATPIIPKEPPKPVEELPPDQKPEGDNVQWITGYWAWDDDKKDFLWVSGFWRNVPPGRTWMPGSWRKAADGFQWSGGFWGTATDSTAQIQYLPQPPAPLDNAGPTTPAPTETHVYVPGSWVYRERYVWRPGFWSEYRPNWVWVAAHYRWTPAGYVFIDGYWDYPLASRGVLFAPVYISPAVYAAPAFVYTPTYVVQESCLFGAFFCRRGFGAYYFGDYFAPSYASIGFSSWCGGFGVSIGVGLGGWYDPLFGYYRCGFRHDPFWGGHGIFDLYAGRYRGDYMRPPTTLVQQTTVINNITKNTTVIKNSNLNNVTMVSSLNNVAKSGQHNLKPVSEADRRQHQQAATATRDVATRRGALESDLAAKPGAGTRTAAPRTGTLDVPQSLVGAKSAGPKAGPAVGASPPAPKASAIGRSNPTATLGTPKIDPTLGTGAAGSKLTTKPPASTRLPTIPDAKVLPKTPLPKVDSIKTNPVIPKASPTLNVPAAKTLSSPAIKPQASRPPVTIPKPATLPTAPRTLPQQNFNATRSVPQVAPRLGPVAATPAKPSVPAKKNRK